MSTGRKSVGDILDALVRLTLTTDRAPVTVRRLAAALDTDEAGLRDQLASFHEYGIVTLWGAAATAKQVRFDGLIWQTADGRAGWVSVDGYPVTSLSGALADNYHERSVR